MTQPERDGGYIKDCEISDCRIGVHAVGVRSVDIDGLRVTNTPEPIVMKGVGKANLSRIEVDNRDLSERDEPRPRRRFRPQRPARRN